MSSVLCNKCNKEITTNTYVKCYNCNSNYHYSSCCSLSEFTYSTMYGERKANWRCLMCKSRSKSPNNLYQTVVFEEKKQQKQIRDDEGIEEGNRPKIFKESVSSNATNSSLCSLQSDVSEIKLKLDQVAANVTSSNQQLKEELQTTISTTIKNEIQSTLLTITNTLEKISEQVNELSEKDKKKESQINAMDVRINKLEQQMIVKNIEIKNVQNININPYEVVKKIANSLNIEINESDVNKAYRLRNQKDKIIVEFSSLSKKKEIMKKINRHRVDAQIINTAENNNENNNSHNQSKYIYINDLLTYNNRQILWITKTKAKECNWKFVWTRDGKIFARKIENSSSIIINNAADIEQITATTF